jgi:(2S)-methylsuccinyl-CoA dehydrogenase
MDKQKLLSLLDLAAQPLEAVFDYLAKDCNKDGQVSISKLDTHQVLVTDAIWSKSVLLAARQMVEYAEKFGELEQRLATFYVADALSETIQRLVPHQGRIQLNPDLMMKTLWGHEINGFIAEALSPAEYEKTAGLIERAHGGGDYGQTEDQKMIRDTFRKFAEDQVMPKAEHVHRHDDLIPSEIINGLKEMGCFGLSIPQRFGGFQDDAKEDNMGMLIVTEELSRGSVGVAGSLITRPEILSKAMLKGGTEEQKQKWLPPIAMGEKMCAVAVTEPDFGSDVAGMKVAATRKNNGWVINGTKTWCTFAGFADTLLVLARTDPDPAKGHKGLSILLAEKPSFDGHSFSYDQPEGGHIEGKAIGTIGYRGMHSFEVNFQDYWVPDENVIGGEAGLGKGFYLQMAGFAGGRIQTAARAIGVMQAAFEKALQYSTERVVFKKPIIEYQITKYRLVRMAAIIQACRQLTYDAARLMDEGQGMMEASLVKYYASKISEWVAREAMQLHGGMGYAEEYAVSRFYVDARVFSIFEGAEDVLVMRVISRAILEEKLKK